MTDPLNAQEESALVIHVPEAESLVAPFRLEYDPVARLGVPAHITVLYPFVPPHLINAETHNLLAATISKFPRFEFALTETRQFPDVLYLHPSPSRAIVELIYALAKAFPDYPPYGGRFSEPTPHLTIGQIEGPSVLEEVARKFSQVASQALPIQKKVTEITLLELRDGQWLITRTFPLKIR